MEFGRAIRRKQMITIVGETLFFQNPTGTPYYGVNPGLCASSCTIAFMGGAERPSLDEYFLEALDSKLGFHQYRLAYDPSSEGADQITADDAISLSQVVSGMLTAYVVEMGVDARILTLASGVRSDDLIFPTVEELTKLRVFTQTGFAPWEILPVTRGMALAASDNRQPSEMIRRVFLGCLKPGGQKFIMAKIDMHAERSAAEVTNALRDPANHSAMAVDEMQHPLLFDIIPDPTSSTPRAIIAMLDESAADRILAGTHLEVNVDVPRYLGIYYAQIRLTPKDKAFIEIAFRGCL